MKKIFFGIFASMLLTSAVYAGKGKKESSKKASKVQTCSQTSCDKTQCPPNCVGMPCCK